MSVFHRLSPLNTSSMQFQWKLTWISWNLLLKNPSKKSLISFSDPTDTKNFVFNLNFYSRFPFWTIKKWSGWKMKYLRSSANKINHKFCFFFSLQRQQFELLMSRAYHFSINITKSIQPFNWRVLFDIFQCCSQWCSGYTITIQYWIMMWREAE